MHFSYISIHQCMGIFVIKLSWTTIPLAHHDMIIFENHGHILFKNTPFFMFKTLWLHEMNKVHVIPWWRKGQTEKPDCNGSYSRRVRSQTSGISRPWFPVKDINKVWHGDVIFLDRCGFDMDRPVLMIYYLKIVKNILCWRPFIFMSKVHWETSLKQNKHAGNISPSEEVGNCCEPNIWSHRNFSGLFDRAQKHP